MRKIKKQVSIKKDKGKNKNKSKININIHIDQSKRSGTNNAKKSNIKTLPAFSAAPSSGGNYARYFQQDPYMTQSQIENTKLLQQYNNELKNQNLQLTYGFRNNNLNDQQLLLTNNNTANNQNRLMLSNETTQEKVIDNLTNDDPRTNFDPNNALFKENLPPRLPREDLNTKDDLIEYDEEEQKQPKLITNKANYIIEAMDDQNQKYLNGYKIYRQDDIPFNHYYNFSTGKIVKYNNKDFVDANQKYDKNFSYTRDPYEINKFLQETVRGNISFESADNKTKGWYIDRHPSTKKQQKTPKKKKK